MNPIIDQFANISWDKLEIASGKGGLHIYRALQGLLSSDSVVREKSYWHLDNEVVCQSDLYETAYFVVPFLLSVLRERVQYGRDRVYDLLYEIGNSYAPPTILVRTLTGDEISLKDACAQEIGKGLDIFVRDMNDPELKIRNKAKELLELIENP